MRLNYRLLFGAFMNSHRNRYYNCYRHFIIVIVTVILTITIIRFMKMAILMGA